MSAEPRMDPIETRAAQWVLERDRGDLSPQRREALEIWLSADARHRDAYLRFYEAWRVSAGLRAWRQAAGGIRLNASNSGPLRPKRRFALVASVLLPLIVALAWVLWPVGTVYFTAVGGYQRIVLDEGSVLQLNTDTRLRVRLTNHERRIQLERGEAYFEVSHDPGRPFIVIAGNQRVMAVGTQFSVRRDKDDIRVSVTEGTVRVTRQTSNLGLTLSSQPADEVTVLPAGAIADIPRAGTAHVERHPLPEVESELTWRTGTLVFHDRPLSDVIAEVNRYHRRQVIIADPGLSRLPFGGNLRSTDQQSLIDALRTLDIHVEETADTITLSRTSP